MMTTASLGAVLECVDGNCFTVTAIEVQCELNELTIQIRLRICQRVTHCSLRRHHDVWSTQHLLGRRLLDDRNLWTGTSLNA